MQAPTVEYADKTHQLLRTATRNKKIKPLSDLAKKYSHPSVNIHPAPNITQSPLAGTFRSGLTPLSPFPPSTLQKRRIHNYQKRRFRGFTAAELKQLGVLAGVGDDVYDNSFEDLGTGKIVGPGYGGSLDNSLHPLFAKDNWEKEGEIPLHRAPIPVRGEDPGSWLVANPNVWSVLEPCLQLASLLVDNSNIWPWWDALLFGELKPIPLSRIPPTDQGQPLYSLHQRSIKERTSASQIKEVKDKIVSMKKYIHFRLWSGYTQPETGATEDHKPTFGRMCNNPMKGQHYALVLLSIEMLQPLLTGNLNPDEILLARFSIATTLVHETAHAIWQYRAKAELYKLPLADEPYFEDEVLPELGWSLEAHMWGGQPKDVNAYEFNAGGPGLPSMGVIAGDFFNACSTMGNYSTLVALYSHLNPAPNPNPYYEHKYWPIPTTWFKDMQRKDKWEYLVAAFGTDTLHMGPKTLGTRYPALDFDPVNLLPIRNTATDLAAMALSTSQPINLSPAEVTAMNTENDRRATALEIMAKIQNMSGMLPEYISPTEQESLDRIPPEAVDTYPCDCPRYDAFKKIFLDNRGPQQLAIDSMDFGIPENTMLRYIKDAGLIEINAEEFRAFLHCCNTTKELFQYDPFPGTGMIYKVTNGWPPPTPFRIRPTGTPVIEWCYKMVLDTLQDDGFKEFMYWEFGEFRDVDINVLGIYINHFQLEGKEIEKDDFPFVIHEMAIKDPSILTLGPRGIARLKTPIDPDLTDIGAGPYTKNKLDQQPWRH